MCRPLDFKFLLHVILYDYLHSNPSNSVVVVILLNSAKKYLQSKAILAINKKTY